MELTADEKALLKEALGDLMDKYADNHKDGKWVQAMQLVNKIDDDKPEGIQWSF